MIVGKANELRSIFVILIGEQKLLQDPDDFIAFCRTMPSITLSTCYNSYEVGPYQMYVGAHVTPLIRGDMKTPQVAHLFQAMLIGKPHNTANL